MIRKAKAVWHGTGRDGSGHLSSDSGVLANTPYSFRTRFENEKFEITHAQNIKSPLVQHSCRNAKVVEAFCDAGCRLSTRCRPSIHQPPIDALRAPAEMPTAL
jgi:hypothetical protein